VKKKAIDRPIFVIGMDRSGTSVISEIMSLHGDLGWISNYNHRFRQLPQLSLLNRITQIPHVGWYLRGKKRQDKMVSSRLRKYLPYCDEGDYTLWTQLCGRVAAPRLRKLVNGSAITSIPYSNTRAEHG
jgi:hypothetical protein